MPFEKMDNREVMTDFMLNVGDFRYVFSEQYGNKIYSVNLFIFVCSASAI